MITLIKICGFRDAANAVAVVHAGVDFIGLNFWPGSKRFVAPSLGVDLAAAIRDARCGNQQTRVVGLFVNQPVAEVVAVAAQTQLDVIQLHGDESAEFLTELKVATGLAVWKAVAVHPERATAMTTTLATWANAGAAAVVLDTATVGRGGSGEVFDWQRVADVTAATATPRLVLAGGLHQGNVQQAMAILRPWAVDVASAVETTPGIKDLAKVRAFVAAVRAG